MRAFRPTESEQAEKGALAPEVFIPPDACPEQSRRAVQPRRYPPVIVDGLELVRLGYTSFPRGGIHVDSTAYLLGREPANLEPPYKGSDRLFAGIRVDSGSVENADFAHCTFANISFKQALLRHSRFVDCAFVSCYFRRADITDCSFAGCRFISCDFPRIAIRSCDFRYTQFDDCFIPYSEIEHSLPKEPNLREALSRNSAIQATALGYYDEAREFRLSEIKAHEEDLKSAVLGRSKWYKEHYTGTRRATAAVSLISSVLNRVLWGSGIRASVLFRNFILLTFLVFPAVFAIFNSDFNSLATGKAPSAGDYVFFSLGNMLPTGVRSPLIPVTPFGNVVAATESLLGLVICGLFVSYLFNWISER